MVASHQTLENVYRAIRRHVADEEIGPLLDELRAIDANRSFQETIDRLRQRHARLMAGFPQAKPPSR